MTGRREFGALAVAAMLFAAPASAQQLVCAQDESTFKMMCFSSSGVRQNGEVRATTVYQGGPKNVRATSFTARVHCGSGVLELTDREGVAFGRNRPEAQLGKDFVRYLCNHTRTKRDPNLPTK